MKILKDMPIRNKLLLSFLLLIILPVASIGSLSFYTSKEILKEKTEQYAKDILMETGQNIDVKIREVERLSFQILSNDTIQQYLVKSESSINNEIEKILIEKAIDNQLAGYLSSDANIAAVQVISLSGTVYHVNPASVNVTADDARKRLLREGYGGTVWFETDPNSKTIAMGRVINSMVNQKAIGYIFIYLKESSLYNIYKRTELFKKGNFIISDNQGRVVSCGDKSMLNEKLEKVLPGVMADSLKQSFITKNVDGKMNYIASSEINNGRWKIIAEIPTEQYEGDIIRLENLTIAICIICCLIAMLISLRLSYSISKPLRNLSAMMGKVGEGDFSVFINDDSGDEVGNLSRHFNKMVAEVQKLIKEVYREQYLKQKAELKSLRMQINPHFLYNTLESINWMARIKKVPEIGEMVKALGDLMRVSISGDDFITLEDELKNVANYLKIQKFRYGNRFESHINMDECLRKVKIPKLTLQPIVENAIVHGLEGKIENGCINIICSISGNNIKIVVSDDGIGMPEDVTAMLNSLFQPQHREAGKDDETAASLDVRSDAESIGEKHTHIGLINVDRRIKLYYGQEYGIFVTSDLGSGTSVSVTFPMKQSCDDNQKQQD